MSFVPGSVIDAVTVTVDPRMNGDHDADDQVAAQFEAISDRDEEVVPQSGSEQGRNEVGQAMQAAG